MPKILVVDDSFESLGRMEGLLKKQHHAVTTATSGEAALEILKNQVFDLILIDIRMPTLSGYDLLKLIKKKLNDKVKFVYVSIVPAQDADLEGADGFIQKPFAESTFLKEIERVLAK